MGVSVVIKESWHGLRLDAEGKRMKGRRRERKRERLDGGGERERGMKAKIFMVLRKTVRKRIQKKLVGI